MSDLKFAPAGAKAVVYRPRLTLHEKLNVEIALLSIIEPGNGHRFDVEALRAAVTALQSAERA
jgi:surfactin synthase thioesterase subunit